MNLRNGDITIGELLRYKPAYNYLLSEYPMLRQHPMLHRADKITLNIAMRFMGDAIPTVKRRELLEKLQQL